MLHRAFGNLDKLDPANKPFIHKVFDDELKVGIVEEVNSTTFVVKLRDVKTGTRGIECFVLQSQFSTVDKSGTYVLPVPESKVLYYLTGGNKGFILGNVVTGILDPKKEFTDDVTGNPGFENFVDGSSQLEGDIPSDFGWSAGDFGWINKKGKIKLTSAGVIVLKSAPFCYQYMLPAKQARLSSFLYDEERGIGYLKRRRTFICPLAGADFNANYKVEQIEDIPSAPQAVLREEKGFCDRPTAYFSQNHQGDLDITGHIASALTSAVEILRSRAIRRTTIAKTAKTQGERLVYAPVYKKEERVDGTVVEQCGHVPGSPVYNLEIVKSPLGYMHVISRLGVVPKIIMKFDPVTGIAELHADVLAFSAKAAITFTAPLVQVNGGLSCSGGVVNLQSLGVLNINAPNVNIDAQAAMTINSPTISSLPVPTPPVPIPPVSTPPIPIPLPIVPDNTPFDELPVD